MIDGNGDIISAEDLDMWGYRMSDRSFQSDTTFYKYTGKERDVSTGFDYFGIRYYNSRIGRWQQTEPLMEKYLNISPYVYVNNSPLISKDNRGLDYYFYFEGSSRPKRYYHPGPDEYFVEHPEGAWEVVSSDKSIQKIFAGKSFFKANSRITAEFYMLHNSEYTYKKVNMDFESMAHRYVRNQVTNVSNKKRWYTPLIYLIITESITGGDFDYKQFMNMDELYLLGKVVFNQQEAGNILWGMTMAYYDINEFVALMGGHGYTYVQRFWYYLRKHGDIVIEGDEANEQKAIRIGYFYYEHTPFLNQ